MNRTVLITDAQTPLADQLIRRYLSEGFSVAATRSHKVRIHTPLISEDEDLLLIEWNRTSPISAKNVLLAALNRFDRIDETLLLFTPELEQKLLQETSAETVDRAVDTWIKGSLFLMKAVLELYTQKQGGCLALVNHLPQEEGTVLPPLEGALRGGFTAAAGAVFASNSQRNVFINGFESHSQKIEDLADFIFDTIKTRGTRVSGKWFRFPTRSGFLSALGPKQ